MSLLHLPVDSYKIKLPFGPIWHDPAVHSGASNYCNLWSFKKNPKSQRSEHQMSISWLWFFWSSVTHLQKLQTARKSTQGSKGTQGTAAFPFVPFLSWSNNTASSVTQTEESTGPLHAQRLTNFVYSTPPSNYNIIWLLQTTADRQWNHSYLRKN